MPGISMALACAAIRMTGRSSRVREPSVRFQWAAAGWIWLVVQAGAIAYLYFRAIGA